MSLVATVLPKQKRTMGCQLHSFIRRIPMALGPLIGGMLIAATGKPLGFASPSRWRSCWRSSPLFSSNC